MPPSSTPEQSGGAPKHRACDECRSRKLACTKEADGCNRCKREGIVCHYSLQKPMGRPRKRARDESNETAPADDHANKQAMIDIPPDTENPGLAFLSFLNGGELDFDASLPPDLLAPNPEKEKVGWDFGMDFGPLNFDTPVETVPSFAPSNLDPALFITAETPSDASIPNLSSGETTSSNSQSPASISASHGGTHCACTSTLFQAIESMQKIPNDVSEAVRQARLAAKTAYQAVNCPTCTTPNEPPSMHPVTSPSMMHHFQNLMLLATLIPSAVSAYERILHIVDQEAAKAQAERRHIEFTLDGYGGMWGALGDNALCGASTMLNHRMMEPTMWRLTVRALLRLDVYGLSGESHEKGLTPDPFHLGLRDIVLQMENRSKSRHAILDQMVLAGAWEEPACVFKLHKTGETPTCQRIIHIARTAVDNLVIA